MTTNKSNGMKKLAVGVALTFVLGGGATAVLLPSFASAAVTTHSSDDPAGHVRHGADDAVSHATPSTSTSKSLSSDDSVKAARHGSDDAVAEAKHGADDPAGHLRPPDELERPGRT